MVWHVVVSQVLRLFLESPRREQETVHCSLELIQQKEKSQGRWRGYVGVFSTHTRWNTHLRWLLNETTLEAEKATQVNTPAARFFSIIQPTSYSRTKCHILFPCYGTSETLISQYPVCYSTWLPLSWTHTHVLYCIKDGSFQHSRVELLDNFMCATKC